MRFSVITTTLFTLAGASAAPAVKRQDLGVVGTVNDVLAGVCDKIGGTMLTQTVCQTVSGSDISVSAAGDNGLALVAVAGRGLLSGASITVPVTSLEAVLGQLGLSKRDQVADEQAVNVDIGDRALDVDLGGLQLRGAEDLSDGALDVDLGGLQL